MNRTATNAFRERRWIKSVFWKTLAKFDPSSSSLYRQPLSFSLSFSFTGAHSSTKAICILRIFLYRATHYDLWTARGFEARATDAATFELKATPVNALCLSRSFLVSTPVDARLNTEARDGTRRLNLNRDPMCLYGAWEQVVCRGSERGQKPCSGLFPFN